MSADTIGIDLGKDKMHVVALDAQGHVVEHRVCGSRSALGRYLAKLPPCRVAMEACAGAHFVGRKAERYGHDARLLPGQYVRAYVKAQKNDYADAEAMAEAATRPTMREVPIKEAEQQELQLLHRYRQGWISQRTETANRIRSTLLEFGITVPGALESSVGSCLSSSRTPIMACRRGCASYSKCSGRISRALMSGCAG